MRLPVVLSELQTQGVKELQKHKVSILADPPGAGKTWTTLATLAQDAKKLTKCLIVGPNQVVHQWIADVEKLGAKNETSKGKSRFHVCHIKSIKDFATLSFVVDDEQVLFVCMSPGIMCRLQRTLRLFAFSHAVLDEVHLYSRPRTKGHQALTRILNKVTERVLLLTANPVQNSEKELIGLYKLFHTNPEEPLVPVPLIRRKPDTSYLPERKDEVRELVMNEVEKKRYDTLMDQTMDVLAIVRMIREQTFALSSEESAKTKAVVEDCVRFKKMGKRTLIVLHRKQHFKVLQSALTKAGLDVDIWNGSVKQKDRTQKLKDWQWVRDHSEAAKQHIGMTRVGKMGGNPAFADIIAEYWKVPDVLLLQSRAGGVGLNLQMFHNVLLPSLDWNPCSEDQAVARVYRRGQKEKEIPIIKYVLKDTIDETILSRQTMKRCIAKEVYATM